MGFVSCLSWSSDLLHVWLVMFPGNMFIFINDWFFRVLTWMMESDRMGGSNTADSDKASSQKRVRSTSSSTPAPRKPV